MRLEDLGWNSHFAEALPAGEPHPPGRVIAVYRGGFEVWTVEGLRRAELPGRFRQLARSGADLPAVGDWVLLESVHDKFLVRAVLPRRTKFSRTVAGRTTEEQVLAANIDLVLVVSALGAGFNLRRAERYLTLAWESGAQPALLLTKSDLCPDLPAVLEAARASAKGVPVFALCNLTGEGTREVLELIRPGVTAVLLGPSGVGKSSLINRLCGEEILPTLPVRESDQKGRHTTTCRELIRLPNGGLIIDTPGLRELQLWEGGSGLAGSFADVEAFAAACRFTNCRHETEPGCAVQAALQAGELRIERLDGYRKLQREVHHFEARHDVRLRSEDQRRHKRVTRALRERIRDKQG